MISCPLPALISVTMAIGEPRYASLKGIMGAKKKTIETLTLSQLQLDSGVGGDGAMMRVVAVSAPKTREKARIVEAPDGPTGARAIFDFLREKKLV